MCTEPLMFTILAKAEQESQWGAKVVRTVLSLLPLPWKRRLG